MLIFVLDFSDDVDDIMDPPSSTSSAVEEVDDLLSDTNDPTPFMTACPKIGLLCLLLGSTLPVAIFGVDPRPKLFILRLLTSSPLRYFFGPCRTSSMETEDAEDSEFDSDSDSDDANDVFASCL
jgi:hypothetical protein